MGSAATIEASNLDNVDYETLKNSGIEFGAAHKALDTKLKSVGTSKDPMGSNPTTGSESLGSIHFLAIRQLSHNLQNQDSLNQSRKKVLKSRSVPRNLRIIKSNDVIGEQYRHSELDGDEEEEEVSPQAKGSNETLGPNDLLLMADDEFSHAPETPIPPLRVTAPPSPIMPSKNNGHKATAGTDPPSQPKNSTQKPKPKRPKPNLTLQLASETSTNSIVVDNTDYDSTESGGGGGAPQGSHASSSYAAHGKRPSSPSANMRVSPHGTLYMGKWKVQENGIFLDEAGRPKPFHFDHHGVAAGSSGPTTSSLSAGHKSSVVVEGKPGAPTLVMMGMAGTNGTFAASITRKPPPALVGGKKDFVEVATLGSGASGVVSEAIHLPSLTLVALKMLPIYNQQKRQNVSRELGVLYKNLAELELVNDLGSSDHSGDENEAGEDTSWKRRSATPRLAAAAKLTKQISGKFASAHRSPHILSLYNAFVDPRSGMINLVVEYMDGGSLEDLVKQGGCSDETVLSDIAFQTVKGLAFLHQHHNIHRDIKPANILCSSTGQIKIADFGIAKALDKTSSFANSFVGTVCYMSPERITGEHYSYSSDIWSLGLTILAVAKGKFPLSGRRSSPSSDDDDDDEDEEREKDGILDQQQQQQNKRASNRKKKSQDEEALGASNGVIGGAAGYWAMIKAICDDDPPAPGPSYSAEFNQFITACLRKDPQLRLSAKQLLELPMVQHGRISCTMRQDSFRGSRGSTRTISASNAAPTPTPTKSTLFVDAQSDQQSDSVRSSSAIVPAGGSHSILSSAEDPTSSSSGRPRTPSALSARLNSAAIVRRASRDSMRHSLSAAAGVGLGQPTGAGVGEQLPLEDIATHAAAAVAAVSASPGVRPASASATVRTAVSPTQVTEEASADPSLAQSPDDIITAIRLEHLDRVLDRIFLRISNSMKHAEEDDDENGEDDDDIEFDADGLDTINVQNLDIEEMDIYPNGNKEMVDGGQGQRRAVGRLDSESGRALEEHSSMDSMDELLQFKDGDARSPDSRRRSGSTGPAGAAGPATAADAKAALLDTDHRYADSPADLRADAKLSYASRPGHRPGHAASSVVNTSRNLNGCLLDGAEEEEGGGSYESPDQRAKAVAPSSELMPMPLESKLGHPLGQQEKMSRPQPHPPHTTHTLTHSILKGGATYNAEHSLSTGGTGASVSETLLLAEDKARAGASLGVSGDSSGGKTTGSARGARFADTDGAMSASLAGRSVHFSETGAGAEGKPQPKQKKSLRSRLNLGALQVDENYGEPEPEPPATEASPGGDYCMALPRTSSFFARSSRGEGESGISGGDEGEGGADTPTTRKSSRTSSRRPTMDTVVGLDDAPLPGVDYAAVLPKLDQRGLMRWENLACQLHLPLHLVRCAVRSKLGSVVDLKEGAPTSRAVQHTKPAAPSF